MRNRLPPSTYTVPPRPVLVAVLVAALAPACRERPAPPASTAPSTGGDRELLLAKVAALAELAPCAPRADAAPALPALRLVDSELAGDAARITFACANGALRGKVTFFRVAGSWMISTKEISPPPPGRDR
jgi:hypothetical protein